MWRMSRTLRYLKSRFGPALQSDERFVEAAYREVLGRPADQDGLNHYTRLLRDGLGRTAVILDLTRSEEYRARLAPPAASTLPDLRARRPDRYRETVDRSNGETIVVFDAASNDDFDLLERAILDHGYYEKPGVWNLGIDTDKRVVGEMIAAFAPQRALELGCAAGAVIQCLAELGITSEGVEISSMAIGQAPPSIRERIHQGDVLDLALPSSYDLVFGLDVFEHLNPNRIDRYIERLRAITAAEAFLYCNIPAFGHDPNFGTVFPLYVDGWEQDADAGRPFSTLHVDRQGYPLHGHLTWADWRWWTARFEAHGFVREHDIERALHVKYDDYLVRRSPARKAFFVFSKGDPRGRRQETLHRLSGH